MTEKKNLPTLNVDLLTEVLTWAIKSWNTKGPIDGRLWLQGDWVIDLETMEEFHGARPGLDVIDDRFYLDYAADQPLEPECGTACCIAGDTLVITGTVDPKEMRLPKSLTNISGQTAYNWSADMPVGAAHYIGYGEAAGWLLGLDDETEQVDLFAGSNSIHEVVSVSQKIVADRGLPPLDLPEIKEHEA